MRYFFLCLLYVGSSFALAQEDLTWAMPYYPPSSIQVNGAPSDGITDLQVQYITSKLPNIQFSIVYANPERVWYMMDNGAHSCFASAIYTKERAKHYLYSITNIRPPQVIVARRDVVKNMDIDSNGEVNLERLLSNDHVRGLIPSKRSYGEVLDKAIQNRPATSGLIASTQSNFGDTILKMISIKRSDYTIMYDYEFAYLQSLNKADLTSLTFVPIKGIRDISYSGVVCPKNEWGTKMIQQIDAVVGTREGAAVMRQSLEKWMTPLSKIKYKKEMDDFFKLREKPLDMSKF